MDVIFLHQNFPAQFLLLAEALRGMKGVRVAAVTYQGNESPDIISTARYEWRPPSPDADPVSRHFRLRASRGQAAAAGLQALKDAGFNADVIIGHAGWGETLFAREIFPQARLIAYCEFFYSPDGPDVTFDPEFPLEGGIGKRCELRARNAAFLMAMEDADLLISPTLWQASQIPPRYRDKLRVIHDGIDTRNLCPNPNAVFQWPGSPDFTAKDEVITFINRNLEPYRGYHVFMRALPEVLARRPQAHVVIVGSAGVSYGASPAGGRSWKDIFLDEVRDRLPMERVHFVNRLPFPVLVELLRVSAAHVYLTYPFVLSWSMLQAMSLGVALVGSRTAPVTEVINPGESNGRLVDFFDIAGLAEAIVETVSDETKCARMRAAARQTIVERYDFGAVTWPAWRKAIGL